MAEYKRQFRRVFRRPDDDPSVFTIELETLARMPFADIGYIIIIIWRDVLCCVVRLSRMRQPFPPGGGGGGGVAVDLGHPNER